MDLNGKRLGIYIPLGYPEPKTFLEYIDLISNLIDMLEIGIPTRSPIYDGPIIRKAHKEILGKGVLPEHIKSYPDLSKLKCDLVALAYYSEIGADLSKILRSIADLGFKCLLTPDLLIEYPEKLDLYTKASRDNGLEPCFFISSKTPYKLVEKISELEPYMIYLGLQASTGTSLPIQVLRNISIARELIKGRAPLAVGFGINSTDRLIAILRGGADIAVVGSEVVRRLGKDPSNAVDFVRSLSNAIRG